MKYSGCLPEPFTIFIPEILNVMPHKHKRGNAAPSSSYNLPPSQIAFPLPTSEKVPAPRKSLKRKSEVADNDTPRAFSRLFGVHRPPRSGLDDGTRPSKKKQEKTTNAVASTSSPPVNIPPTYAEPTVTAPTRQQNESLSAFSARVDAALPLSDVRKSSGQTKGIDNARRTKTERKMQKMYEEWRKEDKRMREKAEEAASDDDSDGDEGALARHVGGSSTRKAKKRKGKQGVGDDGSDDDENPWAAITAKRKAVEGTGGLVGLHDVVQAPPRFTKAPRRKETLKVGQVGLKRQVELSEARQSVVEGYRQMMKDRRLQAGVI